MTAAQTSAAEPWQISLFRRSLKKRETMKALLDHLPPGSLVVFQEPRKLRQRAELYQASLVSGRSICIDIDDLLTADNNRQLTVALRGLLHGSRKMFFELVDYR